jgi:ABC-type transport system substrate-binding protein
VASQLFASYHPDGPRFHGLSATGSDPTKGDPQVTSMVEKMKQEFDLQKQQTLAHDFQKYVINKMYYIPGGPYTTSQPAFSLIWPNSANWGMWSTVPAAGVWWVESLLDLFMDTTKPPLGNS